MSELTDLEKAVLGKLLAGDNVVLSMLREQADRASLVGRQNTGTGFFCDFEINGDVPTLCGDFHIGDVHAEIGGLDHGAGFVLLVRDGRIKLLEGYAYDEPWPDRVTEFSLRYSDPSRKLELAKLSSDLIP